jgi:hypothetical protein
MRFLFVGEKPSRRAIEINASWMSGQLAAKTLHEALRACGIDPARQRYLNLFGDDPDAPAVERPDRIRQVRAMAVKGLLVVALGQRVSDALSRHNIAHIHLIHPAARGSVRKRERYQQHVALELAAALIVPPDTASERQAA